MAIKNAKTTKKSAVSEKPAKKSASKADFVRAHAGLSAKEIVAKAKAQGIQMGEPYVYNVRAYDKTSRGKRGRSAARSTARLARTNGTSPAENVLKAVAAEVGLGRAIDILEHERALVRAVLRS